MTARLIMWSRNCGRAAVRPGYLRGNGRLLAQCKGRSGRLDEQRSEGGVLEDARQSGWNNTRLVRGNAEEEVARLKTASGKNLYVFGSADLSASLMQRDLFDEYRLCVVPVVLGAGTPLFKPSTEPKRMKLRESRKLKTGGVILYCEPDRG